MILMELRTALVACLRAVYQFCRLFENFCRIIKNPRTYMNDTYVNFVFLSDDMPQEDAFVTFDWYFNETNRVDKDGVLDDLTVDDF